MLAIQEAYIRRKDEDNSENEDENDMDRKVEDVRDIGEEIGDGAQEEDMKEEEMRDEEGVAEEGKDSAIGALYYRFVLSYMRLRHRIAFGPLTHCLEAGLIRSGPVKDCMPIIVRKIKVCIK